MPDRLEGRTAIVTGAAQGIGRAIARKLAGEGANVVVADVQREKAGETAGELDAGADGDVVALECDVTSLDDADRLADMTLDRFGAIDVLVNNAGVGSGGYFPEDIGPEEWHRVIDINLNGTYNCTYAVVPSMIEREYGRVINVSSMAGVNISYHGSANYTASKWGVIGFTKHAAWDLGEHGITVNAICPGVVRTPLAEGQPEEQMARTAEKIPLGRWSRPEDQANGVVFLASEEGSYLTGAVIEIDGGIGLGPRHEI